MSTPRFYRPASRVLLAVMLVVLPAQAATAQSEDTARIEELLTATRRSDCLDYNFNASRLIPRYYDEGKFDSITVIIEFISPRCPTNIFRSYQLLRQIQNGELAQEWCDSAFVQEVLPGGGYYGYYRRFTDEIINAAEPDYYAFINRFASEVQRHVESGSVAHSITTYYSLGRDTLMARLAARSYQGSCLQDRYDATIDSLMEERRNYAFNWSFNAGVWVPTGNLELFGSKPEIGLQGGPRYRRFGVDATFLARFLDANQSYLVRHKDSLYETDNFISMYLGLDPVLRVYTSQKTSLEMFGGIGYESIMALTAADTDEDAADYLHTLNVNLGFTVRWFYGVRNTRYFGIQTRYNVVDFDTGGGTDLSGNSISINLVWGTMSYGYIDYVLESMRYFQ